MANSEAPLIHDPAWATMSDPVRERLVDSAASVFANHGYDGARIQEIVRGAGLTTGAVYGRFTGKAELLHEAVTTRAVPQAPLSAEGIAKVADLVKTSALKIKPGLEDREALLLETYVAARREPEVAAAIAEAEERWKVAHAPLVEAAVLDGTIDDDINPEAVLFFVRVMQLGLLLYRGSGLESTEPENWATLISRVVASFGRPADMISALQDQTK
ncbi:MAG: helix-turn-helix domain-containing protein [Acidimicrobiia bacterium]